MNTLAVKSRVETLEGELLKLPQAELPVEHVFAPGVYMRLMHAKAGTIVIGHEHKTEHINILMKGKARVVSDGVVSEVEAPHVVVSTPGDRKVAYVIEDMVWANIHPTEETDLETIEEQTIVKSETFLNHLAALEATKQLEASL